MLVLYIACGGLYLTSFIINRKKTLAALKSAYKLFMKVLPSFLMIIIIMVIILFIFPPENILSLISNDNRMLSIFIASLIGSIAVIPGFIAFPIAGMLKDIGVGYGILASFTTSLMLVGILTFPIEKKYFGTKFALVRNITCYIIVIIISLIIGFLLKGGI